MGVDAPRRRLSVYLGAFGAPGHAFPMLALGQRLAARGHEVAFETWKRWREPVSAAGMELVQAPEYPVFPTREVPLAPYEAVVLAAEHTDGQLRQRRPDVVVHDVLTLAPALAAERLGIPCATLIPHLYPVTSAGMPPFGLGARPPRTVAGALLWRALQRPVQAGVRRGRRELNCARGRLGLPATERLFGGLSERLCLVGSLPALEPQRSWPAGTHLVGPLLWEPPHGCCPPVRGAGPLVLVAPSTAQDPGQRLLRCALAGLASEPVRVLASTNGSSPSANLDIPANAVVVDWLSYSRAMPLADLVICHAGFGTLARALTLGRPVLAVPHSGDMGENAARLAWAGAGVRLPWRLLSPSTLRLAVRRALESPWLADRAAQIAAWAAVADPPGLAAQLVEALATERQRQPLQSRGKGGLAPSDHDLG
jgi:UDP:flavonoid glycosyltransferase YjiC (YdhE family)